MLCSRCSSVATGSGLVSFNLVFNYFERGRAVTPVSSFGLRIYVSRLRGDLQTPNLDPLAPLVRRVTKRTMMHHRDQPRPSIKSVVDGLSSKSRHISFWQNAVLLSFHVMPTFLSGHEARNHYRRQREAAKGRRPMAVPFSKIFDGRSLVWSLEPWKDR